jgi:hypothetical protein
MPDYQKMYFTLFNRVTDAIEQLRQAQAETEEQYLDSTGGDLHLLPPEKK